MDINTTDKEIEQYIEENGFNLSVYFTNPNYASAIIGISTEGNIVYSYEKMIDYLMKTDDMTYEDAIDWIDYNVVRSIPYTQKMGTMPIIIYEAME